MTLLEKLVYRECCDAHLPWDKELPGNIKNMWKAFEKTLPVVIKVPRILSAFHALEGMEATSNLWQMGSS